MPASEERVYRQLVGKLLWIDRACTMVKASPSLGRASDTDMEYIKNQSCDASVETLES